MLVIYGPWLHRLTLITSIIFGMLSAVYWKIYTYTYVGEHPYVLQQPDSPASVSVLTSKNHAKYQHLLNHENDITAFLDDNQSKIRSKAIKITCLVYVKKFNYLASINQTWISRCNRSFFYLTPKNLPVNTSMPNIENVALIESLFPSSSSILSSWQSFCLTLLNKHFNNASYTSADWFLIAPHNAFFIIENLRRYLVSFNSSNLVYLGLPMNNHAPVDYNSLNSGIVLSHGAFSVLLDIIRSSSNCKRNYLPSIKSSLDRRVDVAIAQVLNSHGCQPKDTRDNLGRARFLDLPLGQHIVPDNIPFNHPFWQHNVYPFSNGADCCSDGLISIAGLTANQLRFYDYLIYKLHVHGRRNLLLS